MPLLRSPHPAGSPATAEICPNSTLPGGQQVKLQQPKKAAQKQDAADQETPTQRRFGFLAPQMGEELEIYLSLFHDRLLKVVIQGSDP